MPDVFELSKPMRSIDLAGQLELEHAGPALQVKAIANSGSGGSDRLSFGAPDEASEAGGVWITGKSSRLPAGAAAIISERPRLDFIRAVHVLRMEGCLPTRQTGSISKDAQIDPSATVCEGAVIGADCRIGAGTVIHSDVSLGRRVVVGAHSVLGQDGFGYERLESGLPLHFPHFGRLIVGDDVTIGSLCSISRGALEDTVIGTGSRIDDHVYLAHNVRLGENALVMSGARLNGRVRVGRDCWLGTAAVVREGCTIGDCAVVGMGSVVVKSVAAGVTVAGNPAKMLSA